MKFSKLIEMQSAGAFKVSDASTNDKAYIGGAELNDAQCKYVANQIGWTGRAAYPGYKMIAFTDKFIRNMKSHISNPMIVNSADITFESIRIMETERVMERIKIVGPDYDLTIIHGMPGLGGSWAVFDTKVSISQPVFSSGTMKSLAEFLNEDI